MSEPFIPLSPDDAQDDGVDLLNAEAMPAQPYALAGVLAGLIVLLLAGWLLSEIDFLRGMNGNWRLWLLLDTAVISAIAAYLILVIARPRLHLLSMCIIAAELGLLYGLPVELVYGLSWRNLGAAFSLTGWMIVTGIVGLLYGRLFSVERLPYLVIPSSFLLVFVTVGLIGIVAPSSFPH